MTQIQQSCTNDPIEGYDAETTEDYRHIDNPIIGGGDGIYNDDVIETLIDEITSLSTKHGGRVPTTLTTIENDGHIRHAKWTVYAPADNPYHLAAALQDILNTTDEIKDGHVEVGETGRQKEATLVRQYQTEMFGLDIDDETASDIVSKLTRIIRWGHGVEDDAEKIEIESWLKANAPDDILNPHSDRWDQNHYRAHEACCRHAGDAWDHVKIDISWTQEADVPHLDQQ